MAARTGKPAGYALLTACCFSRLPLPTTCFFRPVSCLANILSAGTLLRVSETAEFCRSGQNEGSAFMILAFLRNQHAFRVSFGADQ